MDKQKTKIACIGDSITAGLHIEDLDDIYPRQLNHLLGSGYDVNPYFGKSGAAVWRHCRGPFQVSYIKTIQCENASRWEADVIVVCLGTNDTLSQIDDTFKKEFKEDYLKIIQKLKATSPEASAYICMIPPIFGQRNVAYATAVPEINELISEVAASSGAILIDLNTPFLSRPELFFDGIHPNENGATVIAQAVYDALKRQGNECR